MDWDSSSYSSSDSASSESTASSALSDNQVASGTAAIELIDEGTTDFPFDFATDVNDQADGSDRDDVDDCDGSASDSVTASLPEIAPRKNERIPTSLPTFQEECANTSNATTREESTNLSSEEVSSPSAASAEAPFIMHRGSLRRIINPSAVHNNHHSHYSSRKDDLQKTGASSTSWPMYSIMVALQNQNLSPFASQHLDQYQIIFSRQQYEFCTRMFALLDTDCQSYIGPECIRNFLYLHCPVVRRRDGATASQIKKDDCLSSPTVDEIWNTVIRCDLNYKKNAAVTTRIGIEGWMVLCRLLALVYEQESQRRFASRHLQQMMRHKHGSSGGNGLGRSGIINPNEVVVVVDNPPPGPPAPITIEALMQVERERGLSSSNDCIQGWPYCPLPLPQLDLDHWLLPTVRDTALSTLCQSRGRISIEPFSSSTEGGFILRFYRNGDVSKQAIVARRSFADFEWLNQILVSHKRPGHGHLCGRILPPFPTKRATFAPSTSANQGYQKEVGEKAMTAAMSSVGLLTSVAKSLWGSVSGTGHSTTSPDSHHHSGTTSAVGDDTPVEVAYALERYLNYLSENEAFATSFPINAMLQGSQTGLESAKQVLQEHFKLQKKEKKIKQEPVSPEGMLSSASTIYNALVRKRNSSFTFFHDEDDTPWLRAAAQVAVALQFHGILETTGYESTSARIQHASLPKFNNAKNSWDEEDNVDTNNNSRSDTKPEALSAAENVACFETGVIKIESELNNEEDMGYDLLPLPGLSDEQSVLNAGTSVLNDGGLCTIENSRQFIYRMASDKDVGDKLSTIGTMNVETDVDKVREVLKSVDHTISKIYNASVNFQKAQHERNAFKASLLRGIDSWCGSSGDVISQRALVSGVAEIRTADFKSDISCKDLSNDLSWQSSLAASAVSSTAEVRDALKASRTATRAKTAAFAAAAKTKSAYESCNSSSSKEELQASQANAFAAQSQAMHATVVEYEANLSLKRASVSLAHDVKCWNVHRRKELLQACIQFAKSQKEACKKASDAWLSLRDGLIDSEYRPLTTVGLDSLMDLDVGKTSSDISNQYDWNLAESSVSGEALEYPTARELNNSVESAPSSHSGVFVSKDSLSSNREGEIVQEGDVYDVTPSDLNVDYDYFAYPGACGNSIQSESKDFEQSSDTSENETNESQIIESNGNRSEGDGSMSSSTSMQSLIDGLMSWGEDDGRPDSSENEPDITENDLLEE